MTEQAMPLPALAPELPPSTWALLKEDVACVFARDPAARGVWEVVTTYPGIHAILLYRLAHALWTRRLRYPARLVSFLARMFTNVDIHPGARIGRRFFIDHGAGVVIGETAEIGDDVTLYHGVTLGGTSWNKGKRHPTLADGVVVGAGAKILGPIVVGARARVGANSVVVKDAPPDCTLVGVPARTIPQRGATADPDAPLAGALNLDHNRLPDPVAKSIHCLIERIDTLERELRALRGDAPPAPASCTACSAGDLCCEHAHDSTDGVPPASTFRKSNITIEAHHG